MNNTTNNLLDLLVNIDESWNSFFEQEQKKDYFQKLNKDIQHLYNNFNCWPSFENIFKIFKLIKMQNIQVIILGQDPYYTPNTANGIAFSCSLNSKISPSLKNIFLELKHDLNIDHFKSSDLSNWVKQGVFLINTIWTVTENVPNSHQKLGWKIFTNNLIKYIDKNVNKPLIFVIWGRLAESTIKKLNIQNNKNIFLKSSHPSPLSAYQSFFNSKPFSKINSFCSKPIDWEK